MLTIGGGYLFCSRWIFLKLDRLLGQLVIYGLLPISKSGVLNAALAGVPKPAVELYKQAIESARTGESDKAIEQLKRAVALYPGFALALNELGVQYLKRGQVDKAAEAL